MNSGTAEQEQNGVTMPSNAAKTLPMYSLPCDRKRLVFSGGKYERITATQKMIVVSRRKILIVS
jgi:hypothetical protein